MSAATPADSSRSGVLTFAFLAFLAWNAGVGGRELLRSVQPADAGDWKAALTLSEGERIERWLVRNETRYGFRSGYPVELLGLVERQVPEDGIVFAMGPYPRMEDGVLVEPGHPAVSVFPLLSALCYPRSFIPIQEVAPDWPRTAEDRDPRVHLLQVGPRRTRDLPAVLERIAEGPDYDLWRCREAGR